MNIFTKRKCLISGANKALFWGLLFFMLLAVNSCRQSRCLLCEADQTKLYRVELKDEAIKTIGKEKVETFFAPVPIEAGKKKMNLYLIDCDGAEPFRFSEEELEQFVMKNTLVVDTTMVTRIITTSDADQPPVLVQYASLEALAVCNRFRKPLKFELRGMLGSRIPWSNEDLFYPGIEEGGGITYQRNDVINSVFGYGPGGTNLIMGLEGAILPRITMINKKHSFNLGLLTGLWPVDGGLWQPVSLHPRLTFNEIASPLRGRCNAWYIFGDVGPVIKWANLNTGANTSIPSVGEQLGDWFQSPWNNLRSASWFAGLGIGFDLWKKKGHDFSFDLGYRITNLKLPKNDAFEQCLLDNGLEVDFPYPSRQAGQCFVRVGLTW
jgi:hypothetical protein